jgi:hypothetical protein
MTLDRNIWFAEFSRTLVERLSGLDYAKMVAVLGQKMLTSICLEMSCGLLLRHRASFDRVTYVVVSLPQLMTAPGKSRPNRHSVGRSGAAE